MSEKHSVEVLDSIVGEEALQVWEGYYASYRDYNLHTPIKQSMGEKDFLAALASDSFKKVVVRDDSGDIVGVGICTFNLEQLPWINASYFRHNFPEDYGRILHLAGMYIRPDSLGMQASIPLMLGIRQLSRDNDGRIVGFDCSLKLQRWLPEVIMRATGGQPIGGAFEPGQQDLQAYYLLRDVEAEREAERNSTTTA